MAALDRVKSAFAALALTADPRQPYQNLYRAKVVKQSSNLKRVDVVPVDPLLPSMANIPLKFGVPGIDAKINPGHFVLVGWEDARPDKPYATVWDPGTSGTVPVELIVNAVLIKLGSSGAAEQLVLGTSYRAKEGPFIQQLVTWMLAVTAAIAADTGIPSDLRAAVSAALSPIPGMSAPLFPATAFLSNVSKTD